VIVVSGSQQALDLVGRVLLDPDDAVWSEDPGYVGARGALAGAGARIVSVPVDGAGLDVAAGTARCPGARLVFVTPSHQFPLGVVMSLARRLELLAWASQADAWIVEDDYDGEYRYAGQPLASLQGLDADGRVIYAGSFSKVLWPGLRLGYMVVPPDLVEPFVVARALTDRHPPLLEQAILADFIAEGHFARHVRRMRTIYAARQRALVDASREHLAGLLDVQPGEAGLHLVGWLPPGTNDRAASASALSQGVEAPPLSAYRIVLEGRPGLALGYAAVDETEIQAGTRRLAVALRALHA
jgi:GntR family transcriptional regulator/MocR family aminotransferase